MLHVFISLRGEGKPYQELFLTQKAILNAYKEKSLKNKDNYDLVESLCKDYNPDINTARNRIEFLGKSISKMSDADVVLIPLDYRKSKGCTIEAVTAKIYGLPIVTYLLDSNSNNVYFLDGLIETF